MTASPDAGRHPDGELTVLVLAPSEREGRLIGRMLAGADIAHEVIADLDALLDRVLVDCGPVVLTVESALRGAAPLARVLDAQPNWSDIPLVLFAPREVPVPLRLDRVVARSNTTLLRRPVQAATFLSVVRSALADRQRQYAVRDLLESLERLNRRNRRRIVQLQRLAVQLTQVEERERRRLASLLHDDLQQMLVGAQFRLNVLKRRLRTGGDAEEPVAQLGAQLAEAIQRSRQLSHELSPPALRRQSFVEALRWLAERWESHFGLRVAIAGELEGPLQPEELEVFLYRSVQELLFNVVKHAGADRAAVTVSMADRRVEITVSDRGRGFDPAEQEAASESDAGFALFSIAGRIALPGGRMTVDSAPGQGCRVTLSVPSRPAAHTRTLAVKEAPPACRPGVTVSTVAEVVSEDGGRPAVRVLIVDDHETLRAGVRALLGEERDLAVVAEASDGLQALELAGRHRPDVVLLDVAMPVMDGLEAAAHLRRQHPDLRIIGLSTFTREDMADRMLAAGADAYFCKSDPGVELLAAIRGLPASRPDRR